MDYGQPVRFGVFVAPVATEDPMRQAIAADELGFDVIGILGAIIGGWLAGLLHISVNVGPSILNQIIIAFAGAVILLLIWRLVFRRGK